jgi:hypothetical protein
MKADSSTDDEDVPEEWVSSDFSHLVVDEESSVACDCRENEVVQGASYHSIDKVKKAVKCWSFSLMREFKTVECKSRKYDVVCVKKDCPWRVHAYKGKWKDYWECSIVTQHTCHLSGVQKSHRSLTSQYIANEMYGMIVENLLFEPKSIIRHIQEKYKYNISYSKAWSAKQKVLEIRFGTFEAAYDNISRLLTILYQRNPESYYDLKSLDREEDPSFILQRVFFSLDPCINAFQHCRPILCIDGTFLTGKYRLQMLTAIGVDGNNQLLPVAFVFVESENTDSWYWFLERVKLGVVRDWEDVRLIHDRHAGILRAILDLQEGCVETGEPAK